MPLLTPLEAVGSEFGVDNIKRDGDNPRRSESDESREKGRLEQHCSPFVERFRDSGGLWVNQEIHPRFFIHLSPPPGIQSHCRWKNAAHALLTRNFEQVSSTKTDLYMP
jgi:hypothetical protein